LLASYHPSSRSKCSVRSPFSNARNELSRVNSFERRLGCHVAEPRGQRLACRANFLANIFGGGGGKKAKRPNVEIPDVNDWQLPFPPELVEGKYGERRKASIHARSTANGEFSNTPR
jgi:hypothetical protein